MSWLIWSALVVVLIVAVLAGLEWWDNHKRGQG